jgi:hypothetical protein
MASLVETIEIRSIDIIGVHQAETLVPESRIDDRGIQSAQAVSS